MSAAKLSPLIVLRVERTSMMVNMALRPTPRMNTSKKMRCRLGNLFVSKTERRMSPHPPANDPMMARVDSTRSLLRMLGKSLRYPSRVSNAIGGDATKRHATYRPSCLSHLSMVRDKKNETPVKEHPTMNNGLRMSAPTSDMYAIFPSWDTYLGRPWASQVMSSAQSVADHFMSKPVHFTIRAER